MATSAAGGACAAVAEGTSEGCKSGRFCRKCSIPAPERSSCGCSNSLVTTHLSNDQESSFKLLSAKRTTYNPWHRLFSAAHRALASAGAISTEGNGPRKCRVKALSRSSVLRSWNRACHVSPCMKPAEIYGSPYRNGFGTLLTGLQQEHDFYGSV